jgi:uncharacterized protein
VSRVLLDTGCLVALLDRSEQYHRHCVEVVSTISMPLATCEAVIAETCYLLRGVPGAPIAVLENVEKGIIEVPLRLADQAARVARLLKKYADVPMDLADGCLVDLATQCQTGKILTLDHDFKVYRWGKNRSFELLLDI